MMGANECRGIDVVAELAGSSAVIAEGISMLGQGGRYLEIGNISPGTTMELDPTALVSGGKTIHGVIYYDKKAIRNAVEFLNRTRGKYPFNKILSKSYPLEQINEAFEAQDKGLVSRPAIIP